MFGFELGREYKLSIAEYFSLFPEMQVVFCNEKILIADNIDEDKLIEIAPRIGGTIKIMKILPLSSGTCFRILDKVIDSKDSNPVVGTEGQIENIFEYIRNSFTTERKNNYSINFYGNSKLNQKDFLLKSKKYYSKNEVSSRFINNDFQNIKSYQIIKEKLIPTKTDFNLIFTKDINYIGTTIYVQDIDAYSKRDFGKTRDMIIGMLPPKLAQMMINFSGINNKTIYDPFCGLGTILLEGIISGNKEIYGSDLNNEMVKATNKNIDYIKDNFENSLKKYEVIEFDAKKISTSPIFKENTINAIITEGYLGEIFGKNSIDIEKVKKQRIILSSLYEDFFTELKKINFAGNIVISFPFWEIKGKYNYFEEVYDIIKTHCTISKFFPEEFEVTPSRSGSLFYKRPDQTVGREIFKLKIR